MCCKVKVLFNFNPPASDEEVCDASLQFVHKVAGFTRPSKANEAAVDLAVDEISGAVGKLLGSLITSAPARDREVEAEKARAQARKQFGVTS